MKSGAISKEVQGWIDLDKHWNAVRDGLLLCFFYQELACKIYEA